MDYRDTPFELHALDRGGREKHTRAHGLKQDGRFIAAGGIAANSAVLTVPPGSITAADMGKRVVVPGAGAGGAALCTSVVGVNPGASTLQLAAAAATAVAGASVAIATDDAPALSALLARCTNGDTVYLNPAHGELGFVGLASPVVVPRLNSLRISGPSYRSTRIRAMAPFPPGQAMLETASTWVDQAHYQVWEFLWFDGARLAPIGQRFRAQQQAILHAVTYESFTDVGLLCEDCMQHTWRDVYLVGNRDGARMVNLGNTGFNGVNLSVTTNGNERYGLHFVNGIAGGRIYAVNQSNGVGGMLFSQDAMGVHIDGYSEGNGQFDVRIGSDAMCRRVVMTGYANGTDQVGETPVRIGHAEDCEITPELNLGSYGFDLGGAPMRRCVLAPRYIGQVPTDPQKLYRTAGAGGFAEGWLDDGNRVDDPVLAPVLRGNFVANGWALASAPSTEADYRWAYYMGGASTVASSLTRWRGENALRISRGSTCQLQYRIPVSALANSDLRGRFVAFALPIAADGAGGGIHLGVIAAGIGYLRQRSLQVVAADGWVVRHVPTLIPAGFAGNVYLDILVDAGVPAFLLGRPWFYVGVTPMERMLG